MRDGEKSAEPRVASCAEAYAETVRMNGFPDFSCPPGPAIARDGRGKPYFPSAPGLHFSLTHSGEYGACAFFTQPVGLDLQSHTRCRKEAIARRFFHPEEYAYLEEKGFEPFFQVWTSKESYLKYTGAGFAGGLRTFSVADDGGLKAKAEGVEFYRREWPEGYSLCLCAETIPEVRCRCL